MPAIVNRSWTPPSDGNRASRTGPLGVMKDGSVFVAWLSRVLKNATCGFPVGGLVPPTAGLMWQPEQLLRFMVGPRPSVTPSTWVNSPCELVKRSASGFDKFGSGPRHRPAHRCGFLGREHSRKVAGHWRQRPRARSRQQDFYSLP